MSSVRAAGKCRSGPVNGETIFAFFLPWLPQKSQVSLNSTQFYLVLTPPLPQSGATTVSEGHLPTTRIESLPIAPTLETSSKGLDGHTPLWGA
jgi:hypothetical protein